MLIIYQCADKTRATMNHIKQLATPIKTLVAHYKKHNNSSLDINHLVCKTCNRWLTEPIYLIKSGFHVCGLCANTTEEDCMRDISLETLLRGSQYPCKFNAHGCTVYDVSIEQHEKACNYNLRCFCKKFVVTQQRLIEHLKTCHSTMTLELLKPFANIILQKFKESYNIISLHVGETKLIALIRTESSKEVHKLIISVYNIALPRDIKFTLKVTYENTDYMKHGIVINTLWDHLDQTVLTLPIGNNLDISKLNLKLYFDDYNDFEQSEKNFENMLKEYECPICLETITEYCYQCNNGHNVCLNCKQKITTCPICRLHINQYRLNVKNLTAQIQRMCKYASNGCFVHDNVREIQDHENMCPMKLKTCNVCKNRTFDTDGFFDHMLVEHNMQVLESIQTKVNPGYLASKGCIYKLELNKTLVRGELGKNMLKVSWLLSLIDGPNKKILRSYKLDIEVYGGHLTINSRVQEGFVMEAICFPEIAVVAPISLQLTFVD